LVQNHREDSEKCDKRNVAITENAFQKAFQQWKKRWEQRIASREDYFEGDTA